MGQSLLVQQEKTLCYVGIHQFYHGVEVLLLTGVQGLLQIRKSVRGNV